MNREELKIAFDKLMLLAAILQDMKIEEFIHEHRACESVAWFMDPALWRAAGSPVREVKKLAEAALNYQKAVRHFKDFIIEHENDPVFQKEREKQFKLGNI